MKSKIFLVIFTFFSISLFSGDDEVAYNSTSNNEEIAQENKEIVNKYFEAFLNNNWNDLSDLLTPNYQLLEADSLHNVTKSPFPTMSKNLKTRMQAYHNAFPGFTIKIEEMLSDRNQVFVWVSLVGVHKGSFLGIEPTGKTIRFQFFSIFIVDSEKITQVTDLWNEYSVMKQLGYLML